MSTFLARRSLAAALAAAALLLAACGSGSPGAQGVQSSRTAGGEGTPVTIGLTYIPNVQFSPVYVAKQDGVYAAAGVDAQIRHHGSDEGLFTALTSGQEDVTVATGDEVLQANAQGADLVSIGAYYHAYPVAILVPAGSSIRSVADLRGRKVGVPGEYGSSWYGLLAALDGAGLTTSDIRAESIGYTQKAALTSRRVDAIVGFTNNDQVQLEQAGVRVRAIPLTGGEPPLVSTDIVTTRRWLGSHSTQARAVVQATVVGMDRVISNPQHALEATRVYDKTLTQGSATRAARATLLATLPLFKDEDGRASAVQDVGQWRRMAAFLATVPGVLRSKPDVSRAVTNAYAR